MIKFLSSNEVRRQQIGIFLVILLANLTFFLGVMAALAYMSGVPGTAPRLGMASLVGAPITAWLASRAHRSLTFLSYKQAAKVYYPGIGITLLSVLLSYIFIKSYIPLDDSVTILPISVGGFMITGMGIKLSNSRHALD